MSTFYSLSPSKNGLVLYYDGANKKSVNGPNLILNSKHKDAYAQNQTCTISMNGKYVQIVSGQATSTPGAWPIGGVITCLPNTKYKVGIKVRRIGLSDGSSLILYVSGNYTGNIVNSYWSFYEKFTWCEQSFVTGSGENQLRVGALFSGQKIGSTMQIAECYLYNMSRIYDLSKYSNNGILTNGPTYSANNLGTIVFDGVDDFINCGNKSSILLNKTGTISIWFKPTSPFSGNTGTQKHIMSGGPSYFYFSGISSLLLYFLSDGATSVDSGISSWNSIWYNVCVTCDGTNLKMYINGSLTGSVGIGSNDFFKNMTNLLLNSSFACEIGNCQIYNIGLTQSEVVQNFNQFRYRYGI